MIQTESVKNRRPGFKPWKPPVEVPKDGESSSKDLPKSQKA